MSSPRSEVRRPVRDPGPPNRADELGRVPAVAVAALYVLALGGRYTVDRLGWLGTGTVDARVPGAVVAVLVFIVWRLHPAHVHRSILPGAPLAWMIALVGWLALTGLWAVPGARVSPHLVDLLVLLVLAVGIAMLNAATPDATARALLWCGYVGGIVYATAGLVLGETNVQGRLTAFGGGPNVFARVVGVGIVATIVLVAATRRRALLLAIPPLSVALLFSGSRGAIVAGAACALSFVLFFPRRCNGRGIALLIAVVAVGFMAVAAFTPAALGLVRDRIALTIAGDASGRGLLIEQAWTLFTQHPVGGAGLDAYWSVYGRTIELDYPHNLVLEIGATGGAIALGLMAGFGSSVLRRIRPRMDLPVERLGMFLLAVFMFVASMFSGDLYDSRFFWLFAIAAAGSFPAFHARSSSPKSPPGRGTPRFVAPGYVRRMPPRR